MKSNKKALSVKDHYYKIIPLALILLIVPCIVFLKHFVVEGVALDFSLTGKDYYDFFAYYKSVWLMALTSLSVVFCIIYMQSKKIKLSLPVIFIPLAVYYVFVFLSSALSKYHDQAFWGFNDRFEGFFVITCYVLICMMAAIFTTYEHDIKILLGALVICGFIVGILGITQYWGVDFLQSSFGRKLILPKEFYNLGLNFNFPKQYIYSTFYNPNYVGSFFAMLLPMSIVFAVLSKKIYQKIITIVFSCISFINLIGCLSTTGNIACAVAVIFLIILMNKQFFKAWPTVLVLLVSFSALLFWMNNISNGTILPGLNLSSEKSAGIQTKQVQQEIAEANSQTESKLLQLKSTQSQSLKVQELALQSAHPHKLRAQTLEQTNQSQPKQLQLENSSSEQVATSSQAVTRNLTDFNINKNILSLYLDSDVAYVTFNTSDSTCGFTDNSGKNLEIVNDTTDPDLLAFVDTRFNGLKLKFDANYLSIIAPNVTFKVYIEPKENVFKFLDSRGRPVDMDSPESIGFKGYELWGSSRGYIWSRSLPLIKDTLLIGHGPDTYALAFPQNEFNSKLKYFNTPFIMVDKPHNIYLQIAINTGVISLVAFLVFVIWFILNALRLYIKPKTINTYYIAGVSCVTAVVGFLVAGLANDSIIGVSAVFWILLGLGIACNRLYSKSIEVPSVLTQQQLRGKTK